MLTEKEREKAEQLLDGLPEKDRVEFPAVPQDLFNEFMLRFRNARHTFDGDPHSRRSLYADIFK